VSATAVIAFGAVSALGEGRAAFHAGSVGAVAQGAIAVDDELARAGLLRPFAARAALASSDHRAAALLERALDACAHDLDVVRPGWRRERVGLVLGTSSGGMRAAERAFASISRGEPVADVEAPTYFGPMARAARRLRVPLDPSILVLGACASGAFAVGLAKRWLERGACDLVLAGGFDEVTVFVAAGFEALRATTAAPPPRPFRLGRDGMALGEGAAIVALTRSHAGLPVVAFVSGFGAASDAVHLTAPDRGGRGLERAVTRALHEAGGPGIDLVSAHATATPLNDASEFRGLSAALGPVRVREAVVHPFKAQIGHALGAAGALELLACIDAIDRGVLPASAGDGPLDPDAPARLLERTLSGAPRAALKVSSAFGGANAAIVVTSGRAVPEGPEPTRRAAFVGASVHVEHELAPDELAAKIHWPTERVERGDALVRLALAAVARLASVCGPLDGCGIVVGSAMATLETNAVFAARLRDRGARSAEPRRFPYTSPNAGAGECSIAFGLTGPSFSVGGGSHAALEALACAALLVEAGDSDRMIAVAVDDVGPVTRALGGRELRSGAVAVLLTADAGVGSRGRVDAIALRRGVEAVGPLAAGHAVLLPLTASDRVCNLEGCGAPDVWARVTLHPI
jgi:3-oxoacyl-[acyl-carrier-protein] synthase-1/3-oxoacyl-[acyl-carrier-protein] synthase II